MPIEDAFMVVMERTRETGSIRTIGAKKRMIVINFLTEGTLMGIIGGVFGIAPVVNRFGIPMPPPPGSSTGYSATLHYDADAITFFLFGFKLALLMTAFAAATLAARRAVRFLPARDRDPRDRGSARRSGEPA